MGGCEVFIMLERYHFGLTANAEGGDLRPLSDPKALSVFEGPSPFDWVGET
jgi:hypothetical protein